MRPTAPSRLARPAEPPADIVAAACLPESEVLRSLAVNPGTGLSDGEAASRLERYGPNAVSSHHARLLPVLWHQLRSPLLGLLLVAALVSYFVGERSDVVIIGVIVFLSVGLGFIDEYRAEKAAEALHSQIRHQGVVTRDGRRIAVDVGTLVPGDLVELRLGDRCWSSALCVSKTSAMWTRCSPTRPARSPSAASTSRAPFRPEGTTATRS